MQLRRKRKTEGIPVAAMGDIAFLLLVFYMATTMVTDQKPRDMPLPEAQAGAQSSPYPLILYLDRSMAQQRTVYFFNQAIPIGAISEKVKERATMAPASVRVYVNIEKDLPYRYLNEVVTALKNAGIRRLVITTRAPQESKK